MKRRQALRSMGALALGLSGSQIAFGATILGVRIWPASDYTRVTIESDEALQARHFVIPDGPQRLVVDLERTSHVRRRQEPHRIVELPVGRPHQVAFF